MRINGIRVNDKVTAEVVLEAAQRGEMTLDNPGFCILCGVEAEGVEPDARKVRCESCGADCVYGAQEILMRMA